MRFVLKEGKKLPESPSFIWSFPSHGNVGQLAVDVIIATLAHRGGVERIGNIDSELVIPMTGWDEFSPAWGKSLCMPIEGIFYSMNSGKCADHIVNAVYAVASSSYVLIQQRAPCVPHKNKVFAENLFNLLKSCSYKHLLVLCGATLTGLPDEILVR